MGKKCTVIGWRDDGTPIVWLTGADGKIDFLIGDGDSESDDDNEGDDDGIGGSDSDAGQEGDDGWPPSRSEWQALRRTARTATAQAVERKRLLREAGLTPRGHKRSDDDGGGGDGSGGDEGSRKAADRDAAFAEARQRGARESKLAIGLKRKALQAELHSSGWSGEDDDLTLAARMIDLDAVDIDFDDNGDPIVSGLTDQVEAIRQSVPTWFRRKRQPSTTREQSGAEVVDGQRKPPPQSARRQGWRTTLSDQLGGRGRR